MAEAVVVPKAWKWNVIIRFLSQQLFAAKCCFALLKSNRKSVSWKGEFIFTAENRLCKLMTSILMEKCTSVDAYSRLFIDFLLQNSICFKLTFEKNFTQCLKITQNGAFEFFDFGILQQVLANLHWPVW